MMDSKDLLVVKEELSLQGLLGALLLQELGWHMRLTTLAGLQAVIYETRSSTAPGEENAAIGVSDTLTLCLG